MSNEPFFIVGAPRSGTTHLRNLLRLSPRLECPEETHLFRWSAPFGSPRFNQYYRKSKLFEEHRKLDGIDDFSFHHTLNTAHDRRMTMDWYGSEYLKRRGNPNGRWFEKTPQHNYGILLISEMYAESRFIHIHRHPLNVVASLMEGKVMPKHSFWGAVNSWLENAMIIKQYRRGSPERILDVSYEEFGDDPALIVRRILEFVDEDPETMPWRNIKAHPEKNKYKKVLTTEQIQGVMDATQLYREEYGYN